MQVNDNEPVDIPAAPEAVAATAVARRVGSLLINPKGNIGGELYINELQSIDEALRRRKD